MKTRTKIFLQYIVFIVILVLCVLYFRFLGGKPQEEVPQQSVIESKVDSTVEERDSIGISRFTLDSLLKERQKLQESLLMEVTGRGSGKAGYGQKAKAIQKELEEMERTIEILQNYGVQENVDTLNK